MKKNLIYFFLVVMLSLVAISCSTSQSTADKRIRAEEISRKITDFDFLFKATYAHPMGYKSIYLSPYYDVKVSKDTVRAYLPYYGRAYVAPMNPDDNGIKFTSTKFEYKVTAGKRKRNHLIEIKTKDTSREFVLSFDIWENGSARLNVSDSNRQPISFQGNIQ